jgi:hypothetical protein
MARASRLTSPRSADRGFSGVRDGGRGRDVFVVDKFRACSLNHRARDRLSGKGHSEWPVSR